jgi:hypothetical protein
VAGTIIAIEIDALIWRFGSVTALALRTVPRMMYREAKAVLQSLLGSLYQGRG